MFRLKLKYIDGSNLNIQRKWTQLCCCCVKEGLERFMFIFNYALQPLRLIERSGLDVPTFATRRLHTCHHAKAPSGGWWNCGREMSENFSLNADLHVTFRYLLHANRLTSRPKEGVLRIFFCSKNSTASAGCEPANPHATSRTPKPLRET